MTDLPEQTNLRVLVNASLTAKGIARAATDHPTKLAALAAEEAIDQLIRHITQPPQRRHRPPPGAPN